MGDLGTFAPVPRSRAAARPPRFASPVPAAAAAGSSRKQPEAAPQQQPRSSSPAALLRGFVEFRYIRHKYVRFFGGTERQKRTPFAYRGVPVYANTSLRCLLSKFFIFIFFILEHGVQSLILGHF